MHVKVSTGASRDAGRAGEGRQTSEGQDGQETLMAILQTCAVRVTQICAVCAQIVNQPIVVAESISMMNDNSVSHPATAKLYIRPGRSSLPDWAVLECMLINLTSQVRVQGWKSRIERHKLCIGKMRSVSALMLAG